MKTVKKPRTAKPKRRLAATNRRLSIQPIESFKLTSTEISFEFIDRTFKDERTKVLAYELCESIIEKEPFHRHDDAIVAIFRTLADFTTRQSGIPSKPILNAAVRHHLKIDEEDSHYVAFVPKRERV